MEPQLTITIPTFNNFQQLEWTIGSLIANCEYPYRIIVINNDPTPESQEQIVHMTNNMGFPVTVIQAEKNLGWMGAINIGLADTTTPYFCMMNDDVLFPPDSKDFWRKLTTHFGRPEVGAVGPSSNFVAGTQNAFNVNLPTYLEASLLIGFCMVVRTDLLVELGGLDESLPGGDDLDSSIRIREAGYRLVVDRTAYLHHIGQQTGQRVHGSNWDSQDHQEATNNAIIRKHGAALWHECFTGAWTTYGHGVSDELESLREDDWYKKHLGEFDGLVGLNLGCGAKGYDHDAFGIDIAKKGDTGAGGRKFSEAELDTTADALDLPVVSGSVDYIMAPHLLEHLINPYQALDEWQRVLKPNGKLLITMPNQDYLETMLLDYTHFHAYTAPSAVAMLEARDWTIDEVIDNIHGTMAIKATRPEEIVI
tara:strand:+ start:3396 stop:4661 length:1266 start_codon:yes stop_codon:yes gene_type:complete